MQEHYTPEPSKLDSGVVVSLLGSCYDITKGTNYQHERANDDIDDTWGKCLIIKQQQQTKRSREVDREREGELEIGNRRQLAGKIKGKTSRKTGQAKQRAGACACACG